MNSDEAYNIENDPDYPGSGEAEDTDSEIDSDKDDTIPPVMERQPRTVDGVINKLMITNPAAGQFLAGHQQNSMNDAWEFGLLAGH